MPYCPACGTELDRNDQFCRRCGNRVANEQPASQHADSASTQDAASSWQFLNPRGPFQSPRTALNYFNTGGVLLLLVAVLLVAAGVDAPYAVLPDPLPMLVVVYILAVIFVGIPIWFILLLTDNVLGFLRHG